jgi:hypothetical protein
MMYVAKSQSHCQTTADWLFDYGAEK